MKKYICVLSTDSYLDGLLILNENLKNINSKYRLLCLINDNISKNVITVIEKNKIEYKMMPKIIGEYIDKNNPQWFHSFDKINVFSLTEFEKIVYLDLDLLILKNIDCLFNKRHISMCSDFPFSDNYNSGVMVIKPNIDDYNNMINMINNNPIKYKGDQELINEYFKGRINELPRIYNCMRAVFYEMMETNIKNEFAYKNSVCIFNEYDRPSIVHYIGALKPFMVNGIFLDKYSNLYLEYLKKIRK